MLVVQICVGSSCHIKGSAQIVELFENEIKARGLESDVVLTGSFCIGKCNREGVTVQIDNEAHTGVTPQNFRAFFDTYILPAIKKE